MYLLKYCTISSCEILIRLIVIRFWYSVEALCWGNATWKTTWRAKGTLWTSFLFFYNCKTCPTKTGCAHLCYIKQSMRPWDVLTSDWAAPWKSDWFDTLCQTSDHIDLVRHPEIPLWVKYLPQDDILVVNTTHLPISPECYFVYFKQYFLELSSWQ